MDRLSATRSEGVGLIVRAISFQDFQPVWSQSTNVTDRQTDRQTNRRHAIPRPRSCTKVHCAVKTLWKEQQCSQNWCQHKWFRVVPLIRLYKSSPELYSIATAVCNYDRQDTNKEDHVGGPIVVGRCTLEWVTRILQMTSHLLAIHATNHLGSNRKANKKDYSLIP